MRHITLKAMFALLLCCLGFTASAQTTNVNLVITPASFPTEISWELRDGGGAIVSSRPCGFYTSAAGETVNLVLNNGETYTFNAFDDWGDGWNGGTWNLSLPSCGGSLGSGLANNGLGGDGTDNCIGLQLEESFSFDPGAPISGCTNPAAANYNACASVDDGSCILPAPNDACANNIFIPVGGCYSGSNVGATAGDGAVSPTCVDGASAPADVWFRTTVPASGAVIISLPIVPGFSSIVELYQGGTCGSLPAGILATAGTCFNYGSGGSVTVTGLTPGPMLIRYWDFGSDDVGALEICIEAVVPGCTDPCADNYNPAANVDNGSCVYSSTAANGTDACNSAAVISAGTYNAQNIGATGTDITSCTFGDSLDVWYRYTVPAGVDTVWFYTCNSSYDTGLSLWSACGGSEIACNDDGIRPGVGTGTSTCGIDPATGTDRIFQSAISLSDSVLASLAGQTILIRVAGFGGQDGCGDLTIEEVGGAAVCDPSAAPTNQSSTNLSNRVQLNWDPTPLAVGCQVQGKRVPTGPQPSVNVLTAPYNTTNVPYAVAGAGTTWTWRVRCACSITPLSLTPFTAYGDTFSIPVAREGDVLNAEDMIFPNPADNDLFVAYSAKESASNVTFSVIDMLGRVAAVQTLDVTAGIMSVRFDVSGLEDGIYFVQIVNGDEQTTTQVTVAH